MNITQRIAYRYIQAQIKNAAGWKKLPKGWTDKSVHKFWDSLVGDVKHKVTKCIKEMEGKIDDPGAFCASCADKVEGNTDWRKGPRKKAAAIGPQMVKALLKLYQQAEKDGGKFQWWGTKPSKIDDRTAASLFKMGLVDGEHFIEKGGASVPINIRLNPKGAALAKKEVERTRQIVARPIVLLTQKDKSNLPALYSQENEPDPKVWVKFFNAYGSGTWYATEFDGKDTFFGYVKGLGGDELGYFSLRELSSIKGPGGVPKIERDIYFKPCPLSKAKRM